MTLVNAPTSSSVRNIDEAPQTTFEEFLDILAGLRLASAHVDIDIDRGHVVVKGNRIELCGKEYELLAHLVLNADRAVTRDELFTTVWSGSELNAQSRTVDAHIRRLRKKLDSAADLITTIRGEGYRFNTAPGVRVNATRVHALAA